MIAAGVAGGPLTETELSPLTSDGDPSVRRAAEVALVRTKWTGFPRPRPARRAQPRHAAHALKCMDGHPLHGRRALRGRRRRTGIRPLPGTRPPGAGWIGLRGELGESGARVLLSADGD